ncbi:uncharacterized protein ACMZJ9_004699 [Mantella aurantiaca]
MHLKLHEKYTCRDVSADHVICSLNRKLEAIVTVLPPEMSQRISGNITSNCYVGSHSHVSRRQQPLLSSTSNIPTSNLSSAVQIGQRLAVIGDEFNREYEARIPNKMAHIIRESKRIFSNCQAFVMSVLRSVKNLASRVDHGVTPTPGRTSLVYRSEPGGICHSLLLLAALAAVCMLIIKLGLDSVGRL